ncbi:MAG: ribosome maturation factor RimP [Vicinamibacteria bacterium]
MPASLSGTPSDELLQNLESIARRAAEAEGVQVVWIEFKPQGGSQVFRVYIEREDGRVGLADCERVTGRLGLLLDVEDPIESSYTLEVSTPGLDRPLRNEADYQRFAGRLARVKTKAPLEGKRRFVGRLEGAESGNVLLEDQERGPVSIPWSLIESARLEVEFGARKPSRKQRKRA